MFLLSHNKNDVSSFSNRMFIGFSMEEIFITVWGSLVYCDFKHFFLSFSQAFFTFFDYSVSCDLNFHFLSMVQIF
jgi:hypothetical protein